MSDTLEKYADVLTELRLRRQEEKKGRLSFRVKIVPKSKILEGEFTAQGIVALRNKYGIEPEMFMALLYLQDRRCAICRVEFVRTPHIDHCHETGRVRGLLCGQCNTGLGMFEDSVARMNVAIKYLLNTEVSSNPLLLKALSLAKHRRETKDKAKQNEKRPYAEKNQ